MKIAKTPFNVSLLDPGESTWSLMVPVTSGGILDHATGDYHPQGLYSPLIFGRPGDKRRATTESFIDLRTKIFQPFYLKELLSLKRLYSEIIYGTGYARWDEEAKDFVRASMLDGRTGFAFFVENINKLEFKEGKSGKRNMRVDFLKRYKGRAVTSKQLVIPAGLRDVAIENGRPVEEELNKFYRKMIMTANAINPTIASATPELLDAPRANLTRSAMAVFDYIYNMVEGKTGFDRAKFARRRIFGSTRNVISSMPLGSNVLGDKRQVDFNTIMVSLYQFLKGTEDLMDYTLRQHNFREFFESIMDKVTLVNKETLEAEEVELNGRTKDEWGTPAGRIKLFNRFSDGGHRHDPIEIEGYYLSLIYRDATSFKLFSSINDLPDHLDRNKVRPLTWGELFYIHAAKYYDKVRAYTTRYPVTGLGSTFGAKVYIRSTVTADTVVELDADWRNSGGFEYLEYPHVEVKADYFATMCVHNVTLPGLGAD